MTILTTFAGRFGIAGLAAGWWGELRRNRRALAGLLLIVVIVAGDGFLLLRDATIGRRADSARELVRLQRITAVGRDHEWPQRAAASAALRAQLEDRLWVAESDGIARANLQDWITAIGRDVGLPALDVRIESAAAKSLPADLRQITATLTAQPSEAALIALLQRIAQAPRVVVVDRLNVKQQPGPYLEMALTAYARIGAKAPLSGGGAPMTPERGAPL